MNETRHVTQPVVRQHGGRDPNRSLDFFLAATPDLDLAGYMKALGARSKHCATGCCSSNATRW